MFVVNAINETSEIKTCKDFSDKLCDSIIQEAAYNDKVKVIFYRYITCSVKFATREKRCENLVKDKVNDTKILNVSQRKRFFLILKQNTNLLSI